MVKVMYNVKLVYKVVIWELFGINLWKENEALSSWIKNLLLPLRLMANRESHIIPDWPNRYMLSGARDAKKIIRKVAHFGLN